MPKTELDPARPHLSADDLAAEARALAIDAQVVAAHDGALVAMTSGVETSTPVETKAPARAKTK